MGAVEQMILTFPSEVAATVRALRALVREMVPDATEKAQPAWRTINFDHHGGLIALGGHAKWATIGFMRGVELADPEKRLQGTGKTMRNIRVDPAVPIPRAYLVRLIGEAAALNEREGPPPGVGRAWGGARTSRKKP